jgi:hypothetical protein
MYRVPPKARAGRAPDHYIAAGLKSHTCGAGGTYCWYQRTLAPGARVL